jgi:hypothetical protein
MNIRTALAAALLAATTLGASSVAQAQDQNVSSRVVVGLGAWIAAQGNAALAEVREDLKQDLRDAMKPLLPESEPAPEAPQQVQQSA